MDKEIKNPNKKRRVPMPTLAIKKSLVPKTKEGCLTKAKKEVLKELIGSASSKIDLNKVRDEWKNGDR